MFGLQVPVRLAAIVALVFAALCLWLAIDAFSSPADVPDSEQLSGGRGFAWFWAFLALVSFLIAWLSWRLGNARA
jgi:hypothetical protein